MCKNKQNSEALAKNERLKKILRILVHSLLQTTDRAERDAYKDMMSTVRQLINETQRELDWRVVVPFTDGLPFTNLFEGTPEQCSEYVRKLKEIDPQTDVIVFRYDNK